MVRRAAAGHRSLAAPRSQRQCLRLRTGACSPRNLRELARISRAGNGDSYLIDSRSEMSVQKPVVLVVDDATESIDVLRGVLGSDYQLKAAINGPTALEVADSTRP